MKPADPVRPWPCDNEMTHTPHGNCPGLVPDDWIEVDCQNGCGRFVWIPPEVQVSETKAVCSAQCAMELVNKLNGL